MPRLHAQMHSKECAFKVSLGSSRLENETEENLT
jgi:hypothetical protein